MFGRRKRNDDSSGSPTADEAVEGATEPTELDEVADAAEPVGAASPAAAGGAAAPSGWRVDGPFDITEVDDPSDGGRRLDLGGMWLAGQPGVELQVQVDQESGSLEGVQFLDGESGLEVRPFAAPRSSGIWAEVREELAASLRAQEAMTEEGDGPFGTELRAAIPATLPDGSPGFQPLRFVGVDGPRWFLRGVISGRGAVELGAAAVLEAIFRDVVVVRGKDPMAPRDPLALRLPAGAVQAPEEPGAGDPLELPERGPEITEIR
ncbi:uncharacterized protein DUF3710 [Motilibacter peucedani]|uniref:Uncharacterized protein DUF3710 n=1 Tax=Motilibacter peucedani TaxID=598650 RepID=A0A420XRZ3_9ACTN|nr:DUF3710 domain-containing protein [Motilibacter peucedani]RKS77632.1 uncharacterized protein DUF3710 [Motilibacter peucedani]